MLEIWKEHGRAEIEPFNARWQQQGVEYQSKLEFSANFQALWLYEYSSPVLKAMLRKFADTETEIVAPDFETIFARSNSVARSQFPSPAR